MLMNGDIVKKWTIETSMISFTTGTMEYLELINDVFVLVSKQTEILVVTSTFTHTADQFVIV